MRASVLTTVAVSCLVSVPMAVAQEVVLTLDQALQRAREHAPRILAARARVEEARGRLVGARLRFQTNPTIEGAVGPRSTDAGRLTDLELGLSQTFELGGRRAARIAGAEAGVSREIAVSEEAVRRLLRDVAIGFARAIHAQQRAQLLGAAERLTADIFQMTERRYRAGDIAVLELNVARAALARARAQVRGSAAAEVLIVGDLKTLLGISPEQPAVVRGDLRSRGRYDLNELLARGAERPELRALTAEIQEAEAEVRLGRAFRKPDVGLGVRYEREEGDQAVLGGLTLTLPAFNRGQELQMTGTARAQRAKIELEAERLAIASEIRAAFEAYGRWLAAIDELEREALPTLDENETLARRSFEVGELGLPELLLIRREIVETRLAYVDSLLESAVHRVELEASAGVLR